MVNNEASGLITAATGYTTLQGTIQLDFADGSSKLVNVDKLIQRPAVVSVDPTPEAAIGIAGAADGYTGHRFVGNSFGITGVNPTNNAFIIGGDQVGFSTDTGLEVQAGIGKVEYVTGTGINQERNVIEASVLIGRIINPDVFVTLDGAVLFGSRITGTFSTVLDKDYSGAVDTFVGGTGTALLTVGTFIKTVRLDEIGYPFTTVTGESLIPIGGSLLFT